MTIQQQLANRVYELLPEMKELRFGCVVTFNRKKAIYVNSFTGHDYLHFPDEHLPPQDIGKDLILNKVEVVGLPLGVAEVLRAIGKNRDGNYISVGDDGILFNGEKFATENRLAWNLSTDNTLEQSDECCEFLLSILK